MWWIVAGGAAVVGVAVAAVVAEVIDDEARRSRSRWEEKSREVDNEVRRARARVRRHLAEARTRANFHELTEAHFQAFKIADAAYKLLRDARKSLQANGALLTATKKKIESLKSELDACRQYNEKTPLIHKIREIKEFRGQLFEERTTLREREREMLEEVQRLNRETSQLKEAIHVHCGQRGREWYHERQKRRREIRSAG